MGRSKGLSRHPLANAALEHAQCTTKPYNRSKERLTQAGGEDRPVTPGKQMPLDFDLTCWYINKRRVLELVGNDISSNLLRASPDLSDNEQLRNLAQIVAFRDATTEWLRHNNPPTLGQLLIKNQNQLEPAIFTYYTNWYCKGLRIRRSIQQGRTPNSPALAYAKLDDLRPGWRIECRFHHEHLTAESSWSELSGQKPLFVLGLITGVLGTTIEAIPFVIANPMPGLGQAATSIGKHWFSRLECFVDSIDSFNAVQNVSPITSKRELNALKLISEQTVKAAFAEIIGEPTVPSDWGGERSDLFSNRVILDGKRISAAFAFKGPAQFRPMTMAQLGKNGDQIDRLFSEPADLLILQHCHEITQPVRAAMRAYAQQMGKPRLFCLIDGYDTLRLFRAYNKCGFSQLME
jgi:hypothetical protein